MLLHQELLRTVYKIWQRYARQANDEISRAWAVSYNEVLRTEGGEDAPTRDKRIAAWLKANPPAGAQAHAVRWEKQYFQLSRCQTEWIGYKWACCGNKTRAIAVPVGCNHRLCPLCAWHRSKTAQVRVKSLYDRLTHPVLLTFTVPNLPALRKHDYTMFRQRLRKFIAQHKGILGGVYSLETTYNRTAKTWHVHAHVLADFASPLPSQYIEEDGRKRRNYVDFEGEQTLAFTALKWRLEFDWLCLWSQAWGKMPALEPPAKRIEKWRMQWEGYNYEFSKWVLAKRAHSTKWAKVWNARIRRYQVRTDLDPLQQREFQKCEAWNRANTRVIDLKPVTDRDGACREVLKYICKVADFGDYPDAVEEFCNAVKGARLIQTFGSWYGFNIEADFNTEHLDDWGSPKCNCGLNMRERIGIFNSRDVEMNNEGRWLLKRSVQNHQCGTVLRPTIRALGVPEGEGILQL